MLARDNENCSFIKYLDTLKSTEQSFVLNHCTLWRIMVL